MPRPLGAALHDELVDAAIGDRDRHHRPVLRVERHGLFQQQRVPQAGRDRVARHLGRLAVGFDCEPVVGAGRLDPMPRAVVVGNCAQRHQFAADPVLGLGLLEAVDRDEGDLDLNLRHHLNGGFRTVAAQLDRIGADLLAFSHDRESQGLGHRRRLRRAA